MLFNCAQVKMPTGGEKDTLGPEILVSYPTHLETNYNAKSIVLEFNELVALGDPSNNIVITPPLKNKPNIYLKGGSKLIIELNDTLEEETTYTINLGASIKDYNESNPLENNILVFSTGDIIDSLSAEGMVKHSETELPCADCRVMLYPEDLITDSIVFKEKPYYFANTNEQGYYRFDYLKGGMYRIIALKDESNNFLFDSYEDEIGFIDSLIEIKADTVLLNMPLSTFKQISEEQELTSFKMNGDYELQLSFSLPTIDLKLLKDSLEMSSDEFLSIYNSDRDSISYWFINIPEKNTEWKMSVKEDEEILENFSVFFSDDNEDFGLTLPKNNGISKINMKDTIVLTWNHPVANFTSDKIKILKDSLSIKFDVIVSDPMHTKVYFEKEPGNYLFKIDSAEVSDLYGNVNDSIAHTFVVQKEDYYGQISIAVSSSEISRMAILKNEKDQVVRQLLITENNAISFIDLAPGNYTFFVLHDENKNMKWDTGNYLNRKQPEEVFRHEEIINVRSNWEIELNLSQ
ncbi:MAG: hypothetical protein ACI8XB_000241 [Patiriisocius sp.]|jgi:hypothetical protein